MTQRHARISSRNPPVPVVFWIIFYPQKIYGLQL